MSRVLIVDYEAGNIGSVANIIKKAGGHAVVSQDPREIASAESIVLPGVGHFARAMARIRSSGIASAMADAVLGRGVPFLGICLGMQLLADYGEEGDCEGLGWVRGRVNRFNLPADSTLRVPHMGWNSIECKSSDWLFADLPPAPRFYFVHSYHFVCDHPTDEIASSCHGYSFTSAVGHGNIRATQFHPEKSHRFGLAVIKNFLKQSS